MRRNKWLKKLNNPVLFTIDYRSLRNKFGVCGKHFETSQFQTSQRLKLNRNALPTIFDTADVKQGKTEPGGKWDLLVKYNFLECISLQYLKLFLSMDQTLLIKVWQQVIFLIYNMKYEQVFKFYIFFFTKSQKIKSYIIILGSQDQSFFFF